MSDSELDTTAADREASDWLARLGARSVSADTLQAYQAWRTVPGNADAYQRVERIWRDLGRLAGDSDIAALTNATLTKSKADRRKALPRKAILGVVAAAAVAVALTLGARAWSDRGLYTTDIGEQLEITLVDGSHVRLDTDTRLRVRFNRGTRRILLDKGQALFEVAHNAQQPFIVQAGETEVTALGTRFDVRRSADVQGARVTLVQGSVAVTEGDGADRRDWRLQPGQQLNTAVRTAMPRSVDAATVTSWAKGRLVFQNTPLQDAVAEVNRYLAHKITLDAGPEGAIGVSGSFATGDREAFVSAASDLFDLDARPGPDGSVRLVSSNAR